MNRTYEVTAEDERMQRALDISVLDKICPDDSDEVSS